MSVRNITFGTPIRMIISLSELATNNGKTFADVTDAIYYLKLDTRDDDADAKFSRRLKVDANLTINGSDETIEFNIQTTDYGYGKLEKTETYYECLAVEFNDSGFYIEDFDPNFDRQIKILPDKIRT